MPGAYHPITEYPAGYNVPQLVDDFIAWIAQLDARGLGHFETSGRSLDHINWFKPEVNERIVRDAFELVNGGDGASFMLLKIQDHQHAIVMMDHGATDVVALSFEEFLIRLSRGELSHSEYFDSDDEEDNVAETRLALQEWISERRVAVPASIIDFDFEAYLDGDFDLAFCRVLSPGRNSSQETETGVFDTLVRLMGRRADDPELRDFVYRGLGKNVPASTSFDLKRLSWIEYEITLSFFHDVTNEDYPLIRKTKKSFVPYLYSASIESDAPGLLPAGLSVTMTLEEIGERLRIPCTEDPGGWPRLLLDRARHVQIKSHTGWRSHTERRRYLVIELEQEIRVACHVLHSPHQLAVFSAWAIKRGLFDESTFPKFAPLLQAIRAGTAQPIEFAEAALPSGIWSIHFVDPLLPQTLKRYNWVLENDMKAIFGDRPAMRENGELSECYKEPNLDDASWERVAQAAPYFDEAFRQWRDIGIANSTANSQ